MCTEASTNREARRGPEGWEVVGGLGKVCSCSHSASPGSPVTNYNLLAMPHPNKFSIKGLLDEWLSSVICLGDPHLPGQGSGSLETHAFFFWPQILRREGGPVMKLSGLIN